MKRAADGLGPVVTLERGRARPIHAQIYDGYRQAIVDGRLRRRQRLPSTRALAADLSVSRIPVVTAFAQLASEGYVECRVGAGTFVASSLPDVRAPDGPTKGGPTPPRGVRRVPETPLAQVVRPWIAIRGPFRLSEPALDEFPIALWTRLVVRHARRLSARHMVYGDAMGLPSLREALAAHLRNFRGVPCEPEQILIVSGSQQALTLVGQALITPGDRVWLEEPGYAGAKLALLVAGASIVPVPVSASGIDVPAGVRLADDARLAYVTPSHQYPLGVAMSASRRTALLDWARRAGAWIVEDDYDAEYRYDGRPLPSLFGLDRDARVLYVGTFSKIFFPALRLGYLVLPEDLVPRFRLLRDAMDIFPPPLLQAVLAELIAEGHFARHLRRMRPIYAERRRALVSAIEREAGDDLRVLGDAAGMHLTALLPDGADDHDVATRAAQVKLSVNPLSECYSGRARRPGVVLGFGGSRPREIPEAVRRLAAVVADSKATRARARRP